MALLAHDLRNPLSAVLTNINFVRATVRGRALDIEEALVDSAISCTMLSQLISNLDILAGALSTATFSGQPVAARRAADEVVGRFAPLAAVSGLRLEVHELSPSLFLCVEPTFFARALDNLVANAVQYSRPNVPVRIECVEVGGRGMIAIIDEGPAIPADLRELVLSPDWQGKAKQLYEARYGRGLGLYCASAAARLAGAELKIEERAGRSAFELSAPLASASG
jgi:signal transduction histidine kinase